MTVKPIRFLSKAEVQEMLALLNQRLQAWNEIYAFEPATLTLCPHDKLPIVETAVVGITDSQHMLLIPKQSLVTLSQCLFDDPDILGDFDEALASAFLNTLGQALCQVDSLSVASLSALDLNSWFYKGSPSLEITVAGLDMVLLPSWVLSNLAPLSARNTSACSLQSALQKAEIPCEVFLNQLSLPLEAILKLCPGEVIKTDHRVSTPVTLQHQNEDVCQGMLGQQDAYKSMICQ